ncbi:MAG: polysaccharide deacetylase family protein, partial [Planctomyces sp.]
MRIVKLRLLRVRDWFLFRGPAIPELFVVKLLMPAGLACCVCCLAVFFVGQTASAQQPLDPTRRYLIVHSDDAGMSHSVNRATIAAMESGLVTSCSIMTVCPWFPEFAEWASQHPELDFGIHLTLNSEFQKYRWGPVSGRDRVPSLVDADGWLHRRKEDVQRLARPVDVETELRAQIDRALRAGIRLSHLDTHMGTVVSTGEMLEI